LRAVWRVASIRPDYVATLRQFGEHARMYVIGFGDVCPLGAALVCLWRLVAIEIHGGFTEMMFFAMGLSTVLATFLDKDWPSNPVPMMRFPPGL